METYETVFSPNFKKVLKRLNKKNPFVFEKLKKQLEKISYNPEIGKPLKNILKNRRRLHIGSFVLIYRVYKCQIYILDFDHHDKIYKNTKN